MPTLQNPADSEIKTASALMPKHRRINYMCHKVNIITQMLSQLATYPDDSWGLSHDFTSAHHDTLQGMNSVPIAVARWVLLPATLKYPLS